MRPADITAQRGRTRSGKPAVRQAHDHRVVVDRTPGPVDDRIEDLNFYGSHRESIPRLNPSGQHPPCARRRDQLFQQRIESGFSVIDLPHREILDQGEQASRVILMRMGQQSALEPWSSNGPQIPADHDFADVQRRRFRVLGRGVSNTPCV